VNKHLKQLLAIILLTSALSIHADNNHFDRKRDTFGKPFFSGRSQGDNLARRLVGEVQELYPCFDCTNGVLSITPEWSQTFHSNAIGRYFSFRMPPDKCDCNNNIKQPDTNIMRFLGRLEGDVNAPETDRDVLAEEFLLPSTFNGLVELKPKVSNLIVDVNWRINLDTIRCGLYFEVGVPIVWTKWDMGLRESTGAQPGDISIPAATPGAAPFLAPAPVDSIINAWRGEIETILPFMSATPGEPTININTVPMNFAKINGRQKKHGIADVKFILGRNYICTEDAHLGINLRVTAPTGTKPKAEFVFEPIVGNGHHLGVGAGISGHIMLWQHPCLDHSFSIWADGAVYHLFNAKQKRTFDLKTNGVGSRYLLFKQFNAQGDFTNTFVPGPNVTTLDAKVNIKVMGEAVIMFDYQWSNVTLDIGLVSGAPLAMVRAHCIIDGWSSQNWTGVVPEYSQLTLLLMLVAVVPVALLVHKIRRDRV